MTTATFTKPATASARAPDSMSEDPQVQVLRDLVEAITNLEDLPQKASFDALADLLLDAILGSERHVVDVAVDVLRVAEVDYRRAVRDRAELEVPLARLETLLSLATGARDRLPADQDFALVAPGSRTHAVLRLVGERHTVAAKDLIEELGLAAAQASRITRDLSHRRLVSRVKVGREVFLDITPHGQDVLEDVAARQRRAQRRRRRLGPTSHATPVFYGSTNDPFQLDTGVIRTSLEQSGRPAGRSRALFVALAATLPNVITDRLLVWDQLVQAEAPERIDIRLPAPDKTDTSIAALTWDILKSMGESVGEADASWPGPAPVWDGWAVVHGKRRKPGLVFLEAKSESQELKSKPVDVGRTYDREAWAHVLEGTCRFLHTGHRWDVWPTYADAATRLAFIHQLRDIGVSAWWMNLYFVDPKRVVSTNLPARSAFWDTQINAVRKGLAIPHHHPLSDYIRHEVVPVPELARISLRHAAGPVRS
jgi:DNA-binding MarR family transcriptional regulator